MHEDKKGDTSFGKFFNIKQKTNLKNILALSLMIIICTMVLQPSMEATAKKNGGGGGGGGKSGSNSSGNSHSGSNDKSNGVGSEHSNAKAKKNLDDTGTLTELPSVIDETTEESLTSDQSEKTNHVSGTLLVKFKDGTGENIQNAIINAHGAKVKDSIKEIDLKVITVPDEAIDNIQSALSNLPIVEYVETDSIIEPTIVPDDIEFPKEWHLSKIHATGAWDVSKGSSNVIIAILDTGFDADHPDLAGKFVGGYNAYSNNNDWSSAPCGHGDRVAGIAASATNNGVGIASLGWQNMILPIKVTGSNCYTTSSVLAKGITYASHQGAKVANISFQIIAGDKTITHAAKYMYNHGGLVVASAGNTGDLVKVNDNPYIISVGATNPLDRLAIFSTRGDFVDFVVPGVDILTTCVCEKIIVIEGVATKVPTNYIESSGTSFSSPLVAGIISLILSENPNLSSTQVYEILKKSSIDLGEAGKDSSFGFGLIDAKKALELAASSKLA